MKPGYYEYHGEEGQSEGPEYISVAEIAYYGPESFKTGYYTPMSESEAIEAYGLPTLSEMASQTIDWKPRVCQQL